MNKRDDNDKDREDALTRELLTAIQAESEVSQRGLAKRLGIALGLTNSYLKRCVRQGWVKVRHAPANRYLYYLTPKGVAEKGRLTGRYLEGSLAFYRRAGDSCARAFDAARRNGWQHLILCGASDLAEIATVRATEHEVMVLGVFDPDSDRTYLLHCPVWDAADAVPVHDGWMLTALEDPVAAYNAYSAHLGRARALVPDVLGAVTEGQTRGGAEHYN